MSAHKDVLWVALGDPARRLPLNFMPRQALHAARLEFTHPVTQEKLSLHRDPPEDFQALLDVLNKEGR